MTGGPDGAAARIKALRRRHHLTQRALAERAGVSYSLLSKVESGDRPATPAVIAACARALGAEPGTITGQPYTDTIAADGLDTLTDPIRTALDLYDLPPTDDIRPRPAPELATAVREINQLIHAGRIRSMAQRLPALLDELHTAAVTAPPGEQATLFGLLAEAYRCGHSYAINLGMTDLSATSLSRMDWAAEHAGDRAPNLRAAREYLRVTTYMRAADYAAAWRINTAGRRRLDGTDPTDVEAVTSAGQLHLGAAVIAARTGDADTATGHLDHAQHLAETTGEQPELLWFGFGPTNVLVHRVVTLIEMNRYDKALEAAARIRFPAAWLPSRVGHHWVDVARAYQWTNQPDKAFDALRRARHATPGQTRYHPAVRETLAALLRAERRRTHSLASYATWAGVE